MLGTVEKSFKRPRGKKKPYGFIKGIDGNHYYFQNYELEIGEQVMFQGGRNEKGFTAHDIQTVI